MRVVVTESYCKSIGEGVKKPASHSGWGRTINHRSKGSASAYTGFWPKTIYLGKQVMTFKGHQPFQIGEIP